MKRCALLILLFIYHYTAFALIQGTVLDAETGGPVYMANIFLDNTMIGTTSNAEGFFSIEKHPAGNYELVIHHIGYDIHLQKLTLQQNDSLNISIQLPVKIYQGEEIKVEADAPKEWRKNLERFTQLYLGESQAAYNTEIMNPEVLNFNYDEKSCILDAQTDDILLIKNNYLGYEIKALLLEFHWKIITKRNKNLNKLPDSTGSFFVTKLNYSEMHTANNKQLKKWDKNRSKLYKGSFRHFISSAARNSLKHDRFVIMQNGFRLSEQKLDINATGPSNLFTFNDDQLIQVAYYGTRPVQETAIKKICSDVKIDTFGNIYSPVSLPFIRLGKWQYERVADWLPQDYRPTD